MNGLINFLSVGAENAITAKELSNLLNTNVRNITLEINSLRKRGIIICSKANGYFFPADEVDVVEFCRRTNSRIRDIKSIIKPAEKFLREVNINVDV